MSAPSQVYQYYRQRVGTGSGLQDVCGATVHTGAVIDQQPFPPGAPGSGVRKFQQALQTRETATHLQLRSQHGSSSPSRLNAREGRVLLTGLQGVTAGGFAVGTAEPVPKSLAAPTPSTSLTSLSRTGRDLAPRDARYTGDGLKVMSLLPTLPLASIKEWLN